MTTSGVLLIDKPSGFTSHDVVAYLRKTLDVKKIGHAGTLDPLATGLLIVLVNSPATRLSDELRGLDKTYAIEMKLGISTDTLDIDGTILQQLSPEDPQLNLNLDALSASVHRFIGEYAQEVPWYSAIKINGKKLYEMARKNQQLSSGVSLPKRLVKINRLEINDFLAGSATDYPLVRLTADVSSGTYTRSLVRDIGVDLNIPATQNNLRRLSIGKFKIEQAKPLKDVTVDDIIPLDKFREMAG